MSTHCQYLLQNVYYFDGKVSKIQKGDIYYYSNGTVTINNHPDSTSILNQMSSDSDHSYLVIPSFSNQSLDFTTLNNPSFFTQEEIENGVVNGLENLARECANESVTHGITSITLIGNETSQKTLDMIGRESGVSFRVLTSNTTEKVATPRSDTILNLSNSQNYLECQKIGTGKVNLVDVNLWNDIQFLCLSLKDKINEEEVAKILQKVIVGTIENDQK